MIKTRILALLLSVCMLIIGMPIAGVWAAGESYTLSELMGGYYAIRETGFGSYTVTSSKYLAPADGVAALGDTGDAVEIKFHAAITVDGANDQLAEFHIYGSDTNRVYMRIHETGAWISNSASEIAAFAAEDVAKIRNTDVTLLFLNNESTYSIYLKESNGTYTELLTTTGKRTGAESLNCNFFAGGGATLMVDSITCYAVADAPTPTEEAVLRRVDEVNVTGKTNGFYGAVIDPKPLGSVGDAVEITLKANITVDGANDQNVSIQVPDADDTRAYMQIHEAGAWISGSNNATMTFSADATAALRNQKVTLKIKNAESGYELSYKAAEDAQYTILGTSAGKRSGGVASNVSIGPGGGATVDIESIKYYGAVPVPVGNIEDSVTKPEKCVEVFTNSAVSISAGQKVTMDGSAIPMGGYADVKIKATKALKLQNSDGAVGSDIQFVIDVNENASYYVQDLSVSKLKSTFVSGAENQADVWHSYRIVRDAEKASVYSVYHKTDSETTWTKVLSDVDTTGAESGINGMVFEAIDGSAEIEYFKVYSKSNLLDDPAVIAAENNKVWLDKDFAIADTDVILNNMKVENGALVANKLPEGTGGSSVISLTNFDLDGEWYLKMDHRLEEGASATSVVADGKRLRWTFAETYSFIQAATGNFSVSHSRELGAWYEYLFWFDGNGFANIYYRKSGETAWGILATNVAMVDNTGAEEIKFEAEVSVYKVDNLRVYTGIPVELSEPIVSGGTMSVAASASVGHPYATYDRRATVIGATYNKEHGYTSFVDAKDYIMFLGRDTDLSTAFDVSGVDMSKNEPAIMVWDSVDTTIPLVAAKGSCTPNTAEGRPAEGQQTGLVTEVRYNEVVISGLVDAEETVSAALLDDGGNLKAVAQTKANKYGLVELLIAVDPICASGEYTLRIQYGSSVAVDQEVQLNCEDILAENPITDVTSFKNFVLTYGSDEEKTLMTQENFADEAYARYQAVVGENRIVDLYEMRAVLRSVISTEEEKRKLLAEVNTAVAEGKWSALETIILTTYRDYLTECAKEMNLNLASVEGVKSTKDLFMRMLDKTYLSTSDIIQGFNTATAIQKSVEAQAGNGAGGAATGGGFGGGGVAGGAGGGAAGGSGGVTVFDEATPQPVQPVGDVKLFTDLESVPWAEDSILNLQARGILSGDGNGLFGPERNITREEFLKLVMKAFNISTSTHGSVAFRDVDESAWYYEYVLSAYEMGIIQGISDTEFGIGENITRADMAVIIKRTMKLNGYDTDPVEIAFVYDDFADIPEYAQESVFALSEAGLMNGVGDNCFAPLSRATRAEAAVSIYRLCEYINERR